MKKFPAFILALLIAFSTISGAASASTCPISFYQIVIEPMISGAVACYTVVFQNQCVLPKGETVHLILPKGAEIYFGYGRSISLDGRPDRFMGQDNDLEIQLTSDLPIGRHYLKICNVKNPSDPGPHVIILTTSTERVMSFEFSFNQSSVSPPVVTVNPDYVNACAEYIIRFRSASASGKGCGCHRETTISVTFPSGVEIGKIDFGGVYINGAAIPSSYMRTYSSTIDVVVTFPINAGDLIEIRITTKAGIKNPSKPGWYTLKLYTSADQVVVTSEPYYIRPSTVTRATVTLSNPYTCSVSAFQVRFRTGPYGSLLASSTITLMLPKVFLVPREIEEGNIAVNSSKVSGKTYSSSWQEGPSVTIRIPDNIGPETDVIIDVLPGAGIVLPEVDSSYSIHVETSSEPYPVPSFDFYVQHSKLTAVSYSVEPLFVTLESKHSVTFVTGGCGDLEPELDTISVQFSKDFIMPQSMLCQTITINGVQIKNIPFIAGNTVTISPPERIPGGSEVTINFPIECGIRNPGKPGTMHKVTVWTSRERAQVISNPVMFATTKLSNVFCELDRRLVGKNTGAKVSFTLGKAGAIRNGTVIKIGFEGGFDFTGQVFIRNFVFDGAACRKATWTNPVLTLVCPKDYNPGDLVTINFDEEAGLKTPLKPGKYKIWVSTETEPDQIESDGLLVVDVPTVSIQTTPKSPDGKAEWFVTKPKLAIIAQSSCEEPPTVFIDIDGDQVKYSGEFSLEDGRHFVTCYCIDVFGNKSETQTALINIDTKPPQFDPPSGKIYTRSDSIRESLAIADDNDVELYPADTTGVLFSKGLTSVWWVEYVSSGQNCIKAQAVAEDEAGNKAVWDREVCFDWTPPKLELPEKLEADKPEYSIAGKVSDNSPVMVTVNGVALEAKEDGSFSYSGIAKNGPQNIQFLAKDAAGNQTIANVLVIGNLRRSVVISIDSKEAFVNGKVVTLPVAPYLEKGTTMVPLRLIGEGLSAKVDFNQENKSIKIVLGQTQVELVLGNSTALVNGQPVTLPVPPGTKRGTTFVPLRFVAESLGAQLMVSGKKITISYIITPDAGNPLFFSSPRLPLFLCPVR